MIGGQAASRYAKALVNIAEKDGSLDETGVELAQLDKALDNPELRKVLMNPRFSRPVRTGVIDEILKSSGASELMQKFARLITEKDRIAELPAISERYQALADEMRGRIRAQVRTAFDLSDSAMEELRKMLSEVSGKQVLLEVEKDSSLIGGLVCRMGGIVMDGSIQNQLKNLRESLTTS
ncbi:MAG: ATP synthase F1 subunit delta [Nitrospinaceae bacterium]|jgi:F-type H+-transporting ATPase subunit delta|nr:ATP synthase F1 subunit delta [Nitrospinaceae bacterium]MBT3433839.1 ATP synthase F1 subunit delta [Nitrospinaceae bacterium]MBT3821980.1 ATP synthase F1 subunit delta [Nitrospinaceae bacterium]MBT4093275.1 ATP synthase F1 subunit delta [Nitrospinaceae bacterium]MBT4429625.1 ATP synthase F1 subunit delta [Nitrospinaceae bacterium]